MFGVITEMLLSTELDQSGDKKMSAALQACKFQSACNLTHKESKITKGGKSVKIIHIGNIY
jgi:hypothetical protein